jgi:hypothetical protein
MAAGGDHMTSPVTGSNFTPVDLRPFGIAAGLLQRLGRASRQVFNLTNHYFRYVFFLTAFFVFSRQGGCWSTKTQMPGPNLFTVQET